MKRRTVLGLLVTSASLTCGVAAQNTPKVARIGWLTAQPASSLAPFVDAFRDALAALGYVEGRNLLIAFRYGDGAIERVPSLAAELAGIPVDLIVAQGDAAFEIHKLALPLPIVYAIIADPISGGLADSLSRPRDNMTGITLMAVELNGKSLELLRDIVPEIRRVAIVGNPEHPGAHLERTFSEQTARRLGLQITYFPTATRDELDRALTKIATNPPQAISLLADGFAIEHRARIIDFAMRSRVPVVSGWPIFARSGALCTYGPRLTDSYRRLATYVDRVLKGAKPADLPIEQPAQFELVVNLKSARALDLVVPSSRLVRADEVIE